MSQHLISGKHEIVVSCANRLSTYLQKEVESLGFKPTGVFKTGVHLSGILSDTIKLNLNLRTASQVYFSIASFRCYNADDLYKNAMKIEWEQILDENGYFSITSNVSNDTITNHLFANVKLKDAIVDRFREKTNQRPNSGSALDGLVIHLYWKDDAAVIYIDTSGETLSKHGYRKIPGKAPMLESLAAATIIAGKWDQNSSFINPMCGSGTLAIEAALMASGRKPGLLRSNYSFMHIKNYSSNDYQKHLEDIKNEVREIGENVKIVASDISEDAINISKINAEIAGVADLISFQVCDFEETKLPENAGVVYFNPEYGDRLGVETALIPTYKRMGDFLKQKCAGYWGYIFTGNLELAKKIGLKPKRRIEFYNGKIDCRLLEYEMYSGKKE